MPIPDDSFWREFISEQPARTAKFASVAADGSRRDPRVAMCAGGASVLGGRYMGAHRADEYGRRNGVAGELVVRVIPTKVIAVRDIAD